MNRFMQSCFIGLLVACSSSSTVDQQLPGKYVREGAFEASTFKKELTISKKPGQEANVFTVETKSTTQRLDENSKPLPPEEKNESGTMVYHPDKKMLESLPDGNFYSLDLQKGIITNGKITFTKVN